MDQGYDAPEIMKTPWGSILVSTVALLALGFFVYLWLRPEPAGEPRGQVISDSVLPYLDEMVTGTTVENRGELQNVSFESATTDGKGATKQTTAHREAAAQPPMRTSQTAGTTRASSWARTGSAYVESSAGNGQATSSARAGSVSASAAAGNGLATSSASTN